MIPSLLWRLEKVLFKRRHLRRFKNKVRKSGLFDPSWYIFQNIDVQAAGIDPLDHFCCYGDRELLHPSANFDSHLYAEAFGVKILRLGPLEHFLSRGKKFRKTYELLVGLASRAEMKSLPTDGGDYRLRYYALKAAFDRSVAEADTIRQLYAEEIAKRKHNVTAEVS
jgi:hypothetical protein